MRREGRGFWVVLLLLCAIAIAASIRRLVALSDPSDVASNPMLALDALFAAKARLTGTHVIAGLVLATFIPLQLSAGIRNRFAVVHRWVGRLSIAAGLVVGVTGYAMVMVPVGGVLEASAIVVYATAFLAALLMAWRRIRAWDLEGHREWMLRAIAIVLGIATTRPVVGMFFATRGLTGLAPEQFFGIAFWIGFTVTTFAGECYVRHTRRTHAGVSAYGTSSKLHTMR